jgi:hypothetical protein
MPPSAKPDPSRADVPSLDFRAFLKPFMLVAVLTGIAVQRLSVMLELPQDATWLAYGSWIGVALLTGGTVWTSLRAMDKGNFSSFQLAFMGGMIAKFMAAALAFGIYAVSTEQKALGVAWPFMAAYGPFLILEAVFLSRASAQKGNSRPSSSAER